MKTLFFIIFIILMISMEFTVTAFAGTALICRPDGFLVITQDDEQGGDEYEILKRQ